MLSAVAQGTGRTARVALRINPDVDAGTHAKITTGRADSKFGIAYGSAAALYAQAYALPGIEPVGLALHIGSQILSMAPYRAAYARVAGLVRELRAAGLPVHTVDCGGGLGIGYRDEPAASPAAFAGAIRVTMSGITALAPISSRGRRRSIASTMSPAALSAGKVSSFWKSFFPAAASSSGMFTPTRAVAAIPVRTLRMSA